VSLYAALGVTNYMLLQQISNYAESRWGGEWSLDVTYLPSHVAPSLVIRRDGRAWTRDLAPWRTGPEVAPYFMELLDEAAVQLCSPAELADVAQGEAFDAFVRR